MSATAVALPAGTDAGGGDRMAIGTKWIGWLTVENAAKVQQRLTTLLKGSKFTVIVGNQSLGFVPMVHPNQMLRGDTPESAIVLYRTEGKDVSVLIAVYTTTNAWMFNSSIHEVEKSPAPFAGASLEFEEDRVTVTMRTPSDVKQYWMFVLQK